MIGNCTKICYVKWQNNRIVNIISNFARASPVTTNQRYNSKLKKVVNMSCPDIIHRYNKFMRGVDFIDSLIALNRISIRSKKYYMKLIFHMLLFAMRNFRKLYRRDAENLNVQKKDILHLASFKLSVVNALIKKKNLKQVNMAGHRLRFKILIPSALFHGITVTSCHRSHTSFMHF